MLPPQPSPPQSSPPQSSPPQSSPPGIDPAKRAQELTDRREPFVRATVVRAERPTSAHAGDTAVVLTDGTIEGFVGGNCVSASVREYSLKALASNEPVLLRVAPGAPSNVREEGAVSVSNPCVSGGSIEIFLEPRVPAPRVLIVGNTPIAQSLVVLGADLGMTMEQVTDATVAPDAGDAALIVASHGWEEEPALEAALRADVPYIALVASRARGADVLASLGVDEEQRARVHSPAGLDLGAHTAPEIALSILAQLIAERAASAKNATEQDATAQQAAAQKATVTVETAIDPVCGMSVVVAESSLHTEFDGRTVYFCSSGCRAAFLADTERYALAH
ncbi:XdhC family protein [Rathayibacter soli]|uniref:XdhC family protein n=1 Tax=Rathayibacter soli TaxID=3144168 RepID=UPI0027E595A0|nr:XdhC family protein [Glaciibacter superstes]